MELEGTAMACLQLQMSEVPAGIWEHQTKGMIDVIDMEDQDLQILAFGK